MTITVGGRLWGLLVGFLLVLGCSDIQRASLFGAIMLDAQQWLGW